MVLVPRDRFVQTSHNKMNFFSQLQPTEASGSLQDHLFIALTSPRLFHFFPFVTGVEELRFDVREGVCGLRPFSPLPRVGVFL